MLDGTSGLPAEREASLEGLAAEKANDKAVQEVTYEICSSFVKPRAADASREANNSARLPVPLGVR